jgi:ATP-dependent Lhr-like helicase
MEEAKRLVSAMVRDHGAEALGWLGQLVDRVVEIYLPGAGFRSLVALENMQRVLEALFIPGEDGEDRLISLAAEWLRYYGPVQESYLADVWGVGPHRLSVIEETLLEERSIIRDHFRDGTDTVEVCDAENMESLLRMVRRKGRREFSALPLRMLPLFLARHQQLIPSSLVEESEKPGGDEPVDQQRRLQQCLEILFGFPAKAESWEYDIFPARMKSYMPGQLDLLLQQSDLVWFGTGDERLSFCFSSDREMYLETNTEGSCDIDRIFPDRSGKYGYWDMHGYTGIDHRKLSEHIWGLVWKGLLSNDRFEPVRKGITAGYTDSLEMPSPGSRRGLRHRFNRWQASHPLSGNWYVLNPDPPISDLMDKEELLRDRVRQLLARYGVLFRELLKHELPQLRWGRVFRSLRVMELSGEVLAGYFFEDIPGLQFVSHSAFQELGQPLPSDAVYWMNATDPASLCGVRIEGIDPPLPRRVNSNYLVFRGERLVVALGRTGREVAVYVPPEDEGIPVYLRVFHALLSRPINPVAQIRVDTINEKPALESAYLDQFIQFGFVKGYRGLLLRRGYR